MDSYLQWAVQRKEQSLEFYVLSIFSLLTFTPKHEYPGALVGRVSDSERFAITPEIFHGYLEIYSDLHVLKYYVLNGDAEWKSQSVSCRNANSSDCTMTFVDLLFPLLSFSCWNRVSFYTLYYELSRTKTLLHLL